MCFYLRVVKFGLGKELFTSGTKLGNSVDYENTLYANSHKSSQDGRFKWEIVVSPASPVSNI